MASDQPKAKGNPNDKRINVRVSFGEHAAWVALAEGRGKTISELIRGAVNKDAKTRPPATPPRSVPTRLADPALLAVLGRIGNNLNQLARVANTKGDLPTLVQLAAIERELKALDLMRIICSRISCISVTQIQEKTSPIFQKLNALYHLNTCAAILNLL